MFDGFQCLVVISFDRLCYYGQVCTHGVCVCLCCYANANTTDSCIMNERVSEYTEWFSLLPFSIDT